MALMLALFLVDMARMSRRVTAHSSRESVVNEPMQVSDGAGLVASERILAKQA
jgi:hypothetical protein